MRATRGRPGLAALWLWAAALGIVFAAATAGPAAGQAAVPPADMEDAIRRYLAAHPEALAPAIEKYLVDHPEALRDAILALAAKRGAIRATAAPTQAIADNAQALYAAPLQTAVGAGEGAPTVVEFFDFNCGFCRKALGDMLSLIADEPRLRIVLKEFPVLGPASTEAAKIALALQMRRPDAATSFEFHRRLLASRGRIDGAAALAVAADLGFDIGQTEKDAASAEVDAALQQNIRLAAALGIHGTPAYVIGGKVVAGAVGTAALQAQIAVLKKP
jgi:protein-disulfide isomerase